MSKKGGYVYLLGDFGKENMFKIGVTSGDINKRIKKLQTGNSGEIYLVDYFWSEHPFYVEKWMHMEYGSNRISGEWFELGIEDMKNFKTLCDKYDGLYKYTKIGNYEV